MSPRLGIRRRSLALTAALLLAAGTNYCLVAGLAGVPMSCFGDVAKTTAPTGHCAAHAPDETAAPAALPGELPPCCVSLISTVTPVVACPSADAADAPSLLGIVPADIAVDAPSRWIAVAADESPPPLRSTPAPLRGRAPPIS